MEEKYLITFKQLREICNDYFPENEEYTCTSNETDDCSKETCPILKTLERP